MGNRGAFSQVRRVRPDNFRPKLGLIVKLDVPARPAGRRERSS